MERESWDVVGKKQVPRSARNDKVVWWNDKVVWRNDNGSAGVAMARP